MRIDAIRDEIENKYRDSWMYSPLLVALMLAADKVDSTVGVQMAYLKSWAQRSYGEMTLRTPDIPEGPGGLALCEDAVKLVRDYAGAVKSSEGGTVPEADVTILSQAPQYADIYSQEAINKLHTPDLIYIDPPYNQHKYFSNYHIWETLIRWDDPVPYGVAHKREDARSAQNSSAFNSKPRIYSALMDLFTSCYDSGAKVIMVSYNNESWIDRDSMHDALSQAGWGNVQSLAFSSKRYVGSQIGVHNQAGERVGVPGADKNIEYVFLAGNRSAIRRAVTAIESGNAGQRSIDEQSVT